MFNDRMICEIMKISLEIRRCEMKTIIGFVIAVFAAGLVTTAGAADFQITSTAFGNGEKVPSLYTCDGKDVSPPLAWSGTPEGTKAFALIMDDPDAPGGTWVHWVIYNIPADAASLPQGVPTDATLASGAMQGSNSWKRTGYGGPCPPSGSHRYYFKLYALSDTLDLKSGANKRKLLKAMKGKVLGQVELMARFR
jgi:Raf kinase inhibitor-like YbhB/YbcL family protein